MTDGSDDTLRPTTKDLARVAGVSRATVDRVLNGRLGVRQQTVDKVNAAIRDLGFVRNIAAANLAKGRGYRFLFVLPRTGDLFLESLTSRINESVSAFAGDNLRADVHHVDMGDPHALAGHLASLPDRRWDGVAIMAPRSPQLRDATRRLTDRGIAVLPFVSGQHAAISADFVGIDNRAAGATAGLLMGRFIGPRTGTVLVMAETMQSQDSLDRRHGFDRLIGERFPGLTALPSLESYGSVGRTRAILANSLRYHTDLCGIYVLGSEARLPLAAMALLNVPRDVVRIVHERTPVTECALTEDRVDAVITQDPGHLVRSALRRLKARCDGFGILASQERIRTEILLSTNL